VKFGIALPYVDARSVAELARLAEQTGWDGVWGDSQEAVKERLHQGPPESG
jgi:hypothetical protein